MEFKVWDNLNGVHVRVGTDADTGCVVVSDVAATILLPPHQALLVAEAIKKVADNINLYSL